MGFISSNVCPKFFLCSEKVYEFSNQIYFENEIMKKVEISISSNGIKNLEFLPINRDFTFIAGGREYPTFKLVACILSPAIALNLKNNPDMNKYELPFDDPQGYFQIIFDIAYDHSYEINLENCFFIYRVAKVFENKELEEIASIKTNSRITEQNCFNLLLKMYESDYPETNQVISYIAQNFDILISQRIIKSNSQASNPTTQLTNDLLNLPIELFNIIFQCNDFKIQNRTYNLLVSILNVRPDFMKSFKKVIFDHSEELSPQDLQDFVRYIDDDDFPIAGQIIRDAVMRAKS